MIVSSTCEVSSAVFEIAYLAAETSDLRLEEIGLSSQLVGSKLGNQRMSGKFEQRKNEDWDSNPGIRFLPSSDLALGSLKRCSKCFSIPDPVIFSLIAEKSPLVGMTKRHLPSLRHARTAPTAILSRLSSLVIAFPPLYSTARWFTTAFFPIQFSVGMS